MMSKLQQRQLRCKAALQIDCEAVHAEQAPSQTCAQVSDEYDVLGGLGQGSTGIVQYARRKADGKDVALKMPIKLNAEIADITCMEYHLLRSIDHPHIIRALDFFETPSSVALVLEFFPCWTLERTVRHEPRQHLREGESKCLFRMLIQALDYLHRRRIVHRDVKADNVLVARDLADLKLADFNTAKRLMEGASMTMTGTRLYMAPETIMGEPPSERNDVWAAGLCLYFMLSGRVPKRHDHFARAAEFGEGVTAASPVPYPSKHWGSVTQPCKNFVRACLEVNKDLRPAPMILLQHAWLQVDPRARGPEPSPPKRSASWQSVRYG